MGYPELFGIVFVVGCCLFALIVTILLHIDKKGK